MSTAHRVRGSGSAIRQSRPVLKASRKIFRGERPGGADTALLKSVEAYGRCFGLAFQITDDLLDVESTPAQAGKAVGKDAARGKLTYPAFWGAAESRRRAELLCEQACEHLRPLGAAAHRLAELSTFILRRSG